MFRIGIDVGGTFTDLVSVDAQGRVALAKAASTPADQSLGVMDGLDRLAETLGIDRATMLARTERIVHGTTVATNALLEHKGAKVGLLTTEGHRDVVEMREGLKDDRYNLRMPPPEQLVPRRLRLPVRERMRADGRIDTPLDPASLEAAIAVLQRERVESVAVCYLHAWCDPGHERRTGEALARALPDAYVSLSSAVLPQIKEFERVSTTIVNAYVGPVLSRYLARLESRRAGAGLLRPGRRRAHRYRRQPCARLSRPGEFSRRRAPSARRLGRARRRSYRRGARHRSARRGARHSPRHQHEYGRGSAPRFGPAWR